MHASLILGTTFKVVVYSWGYPKYYVNCKRLKQEGAVLHHLEQQQGMKTNKIDAQDSRHYFSLNSGSLGGTLSSCERWLEIALVLVVSVLSAVACCCLLLLLLLLWVNNEALRNGSDSGPQ